MSNRTAEHIRLEEEQRAKSPWKKWGPYLSERQWGTVREDLQRQRGRLELLQPRPGTFACLSLAGTDISVRISRLSVQEVSTELSHRLIRIFTRQNGERPVYGGSKIFQENTDWRHV